MQVPRGYQAVTARMPAAERRLYRVYAPALAIFFTLLIGFMEGSL